MPRGHMLPVYARVKPTYGQNLVELAAKLADFDDTEVLRVLDIGANIGDSAMQINARTGAHVLCVEGDPYWARYLHVNVDGYPNITVEEALLLPHESHVEHATAVRAHGTTRFVKGGDSTSSLPKSTATDIRRRHPDFRGVRLIKSDTDGYDPALVPAAAYEWRGSSPVLFFEFDPSLAREVGTDPDAIWADLAELGYTRLAVWDNAGDPLGQLDIAEVSRYVGSLEPKPLKLGYHFWDVGACHTSDLSARAAFDALVPESFSVRGIRR